MKRDLVAVQNEAARALADLARDTIRPSRSLGAARGLAIEAWDENGPVMRARFQFDIERLQ